MSTRLAIDHEIQSVQFNELKMKVTQFLQAGLLLHGVDAFWRMNCGTIQLGRIDPIINPGGISGHVHILAGPNSTLRELHQPNGI